MYRLLETLPLKLPFANNSRLGSKGDSNMGDHVGRPHVLYQISRETKVGLPFTNNSHKEDAQGV